MLEAFKSNHRKFGNNYRTTRIHKGIDHHTHLIRSIVLSFAETTLALLVLRQGGWSTASGRPWFKGTATTRSLAEFSSKNVHVIYPS